MAYRGAVPLVVYSAQRLALFLGALAVLAWLEVGGWLLVVLAAVIGWALAYVLLSGSRDRAAGWIARRVASRSGPTDPDAGAEDAEALQGQAKAEQRAVAELEQAGAGQDGLEQHPPGAEHDGGGQQPDRQGEQQHEQ